MTVESEAVTVTAAPTALNVAEGQGSGKVSITVRNDSGSTIYLGGDDVSTSNGLPLATGRVTVHPTHDGTAEGDPLFARTVGMSILPLLGLLGGSGDDEDPATGVAIATLVGQTIDPVTFDHPTEFVFELSRVVDADPAGGPVLDAVPDGTLAFLTIFGIPA